MTVLSLPDDRTVTSFISVSHRSDRTVISAYVFSREPRLYKRVCPSVGPSVGRSVSRSVRNLFFRRAETRTANDLCRESGLVAVVVVVVFVVIFIYIMNILSFCEEIVSLSLPEFRRFVFNV